jgi:hypothetical protein
MCSNRRLDRTHPLGIQKMSVIETTSLWERVTAKIIIMPCLLGAELVVLTLLLWRPAVEVRVDPNAINAEIGHAFVMQIPNRVPSPYRLAGDSMERPLQSNLVVLRDGHTLGPAHSSHQHIREHGNGAYSHWGDVLYLSSPGNGDPRVDGASYTVKARAELNPLAGVSLVIMSLGLGTLLLRRALRLSVIRAAWIACRGATGRVALCLVVAVIIGIQMSGDWSEYVITPDSGSWVLNPFVEEAVRPPIVPVWHGLFSDRQEIADRISQIAAAGQWNTPMIAAADDPVIPGIQGQRVLLLASFAILSLALGLVMHPVLASLMCIIIAVGIRAILIDYAVGVSLLGLALLALLAAFGLRASDRPTSSVRAGFGSAAIAGFFDAVHRLSPRNSAIIIARLLLVGGALLLFLPPIAANSFLSGQQTWLHSEALTMAWLALFVASLVWFVQTSSLGALLCCALFASLSFLTRPAAVFVFVLFLGVAALALYRDWRRFFVPVIASTAIAILLMQSVTLFRFLTGRPDPVSMTSWGPMAFAILVAQPEDESILPDELSKEFLRASLKGRNELMARQPPSPFRALHLDGMLYEIALPAAADAITQHGQEGGRNRMNELFWRTAGPVLCKRWKEYAGIVFDSVLTATGLHPAGSTTRIFSSFYAWVVLAFMLLLSLWRATGPSKKGLLTLFLLAGHSGQILIASIFDYPLGRYIYATEMLVVLAIFLLVMEQIAALRELFSPLHNHGSGKAPLMASAPTAPRSTQSEADSALRAHPAREAV